MMPLHQEAAPPFVAQLSSVDASDDDLTLAHWRLAPVLVARDCKLTPQQLLRIATLFGHPVEAPVQERKVVADGLPSQIMVVSNIVRNGLAIGHLGHGDLSWHTDMCYTPVPAVASLLYALEVPSHGGDTWFLDMRAVCRRLPKALALRLRGLSCKHDDSCTAAGDLRAGRQMVCDIVHSSGAIHPLIGHDIRSGEETLYLGRRLNAYIPSLLPVQSNALLDELWSYCADPAMMWRHRWRSGDLLIWDNRVTMHRRDAFLAQSRRLLLRAQVR